MWARRRAELKDIIQYFEYGRLPPKPDHVATESVSDRALANGIGIEQRMTLVIGSDRRLTMQIAIARPRKPGRLPVIVAEVHAISPLPCIPMFVRRGYMFVQYQREDLDPDLPAVLGPAQKAYPEYDWATLAVWAWGAMRVADYLESRDDVDVAHIAVTGHSRGGKAALLAGALDERFALVAPNGSGCGGAGCFRNTPRRAESLAQITDPKRFGYWFHPRLRWFAGREERLPFDQHFLKALVAPRSLLCTEARGDLWANPSGAPALQLRRSFNFSKSPIETVCIGATDAMIRHLPTGKPCLNSPSGSFSDADLMTSDHLHRERAVSDRTALTSNWSSAPSAITDHMAGRSKPQIFALRSSRLLAYATHLAEARDKGGSCGG